VNGGCSKKERCSSENERLGRGEGRKETGRGSRGVSFKGGGGGGGGGGALGGLVGHLAGRTTQSNGRRRGVLGKISNDHLTGE